MSVFTSRVTKSLDIPHDAGQSVVIRKLAPRHLHAASKEAQRAAIADMKAMGVSFLKELRELKDEDVEQAKTADPLLTYDKELLVLKGVASWSYDAPVNEETVADLDEETQDFIAREVLRLSRPAAFQTEQEIEAERKNG